MGVKNPLSSVKKYAIFKNIQVFDSQIDQIDLARELANVKATYALFSFQISFSLSARPGFDNSQVGIGEMNSVYAICRH